MIALPGRIAVASLLVAVAIALPACRNGVSAVPTESQTGAPSPTSSASGAGTRIRFADLVNVDVRDVPLLMAFDDLVARGYVIEKTYLTTSTLITDALARGDVDVAMSNTQTAWGAVAKGADVTTVGEATGPSNVLVANERIGSCADLDGRPMGVSSLSGFSPLLITLFFERHCPGIEPRSLLLPESSSRAAALLSGRVDATMLPTDDFLTIQRQSSVPFHVLMAQAADFPDLKIDALHVRRAWALEHPRAVEDLIRAQLEAHRLVAAQPARLYEESVRRLSVERAAVEAVANVHLAAGTWDLNGGLTRENIASSIDFLTTAGALPAGMTAAQVADLSYLDRVLDDIGRAP
jgi:ABC-type nitrate/sulfonate/bicarbonate transport system substrate-binding protein